MVDSRDLKGVSDEAGHVRQRFGKADKGKELMRKHLEKLHRFQIRKKKPNPWILREVISNGLTNRFKPISKRLLVGYFHFDLHRLHYNVPVPPLKLFLKTSKLTEK